MNLLFYVPLMAPYGGIERHVCSLARAAAQKGDQVRLITTSNSLGAELRDKLIHPKITFLELPAPRMTVGLWAKLRWLRRSSHHQPGQPWDIIYTNGQSGLSYIVWLAGGPVTRIVHHHHNTGDIVEQKTWSFLFRWVLKKAPFLIGCSRSTCSALNRSVNRADAIFMPYLTACPIENVEIAERAPFAPLRFGLCGRLIPEKGIETILALARQPELSDIEWHIYGAGEAYPPERFENKDRVVYHGAYRSVSEHASALLSLDAAVLFSTHNEGMPLSLIECMSAGLPWIATDRGGTSELIESAEDSVLVPAATAAKEMAPYVRSLARRIIAGQASRRRQRLAYDRRFGPKTVTKSWLEFFARIQQRPAGSPMQTND